MSKALKNKFASSFLLVSLLVTACFAPSPVLAADSVKNKLARVEKVLFFKTYPDESVEKRIARLEKRFFGEAASGDIDERVEKIYKLAEPQISAAEQKSGTDSTLESDSPDSKNVQYPKKTKAQEEKDRAKKLAVLKARDEEIKALLKEGISFWKAKDSKHAIDRFNQVIRLDPQNAEAYFSMGVIFEAGGQLKNALGAYSKANEINPNRLDYKEAIVVVKKRLDKEGAIDSLAMNAAAAFKRKEYISALDLYKQLENKYPKNAKYKYNIGTIYLLMKSPEQALEYYGKAKKLDPKTAKYKTAYTKLSETLKSSSAARQKRESAWDKHMEAKKQMMTRRPSPGQNGSSKTGLSPYMTPGQTMPPNQNGATSSMPASNPNMGRPPQSSQPQPQAPGQTPALVKQVLSAMGLIIVRSPGGITVNTVGIGSRAAKSGVKVGDIILGVNGINITSPTQLALTLTKLPKGQKAALLVKRHGQVGQIMF